MNNDLQDILFNTFQFKADECNGKVVVVTGSGRGIGLQAARAFGLLGARVVIAERSEQGQQAADAICRSGGQALYVQTDVSNSASVRQLVETTHQVFGPADIVVNNAIRIAVAPVSEMDESLWDEILSVNLRGTFLISKAFLPDLLARKDGVILNMISTEAMPGLSAYIASKQAILGFTQSLALEVGSSGVKVIPFSPGMVDTPGIRGVAADLAPRLGMTQEQFLHISLHAAYDGFMPPEHAGAAAVYLALRLASAYHGQAVTGYEVLEQAGLLPSYTGLPAGAETAAPANHPSQTGAKDIQRLADQLREVIAETAREFEKLPGFVRPIARSGFKGKSGASLEDWQKLLSAFQPDKVPQAAPGLIPRLEKLAHYYQGVPAETARFSKDKELLAEVQRISAERIALIQALAQALEKA